MGIQFWAASEDIKGLANELIASFHNEIVGASIGYVMKSDATRSEADAGQVCIAKKVSNMYRELTTDTLDFIIVIANDLFNDLSPSQQRAALDSALSSCSAKVEDGEFKVDAAGNPIWIIKPYDIIAHSEIISRYGVDILRETGERVRAAVQADDHR